MLSFVIQIIMLVIFCAV